MLTTRRIALLGLLCALCFGLSYIEFLLPFTITGIPGVKLGCANICVMAALYLYGFKEAAAVNLGRILLSWLFFGSFTGLIYSLCGGILSLLGMWLLIKIDRFSCVGVSALGGVLHNLGQILAACLLLGMSVWGYLPVLTVVGSIAGAVNGGLLAILLARLRKTQAGCGE